MKRKLLVGVLVLLVVAYALTGVVQVRSGERGVVRRFGRVLAYKPEPGLWVGLPWGMDTVDRVVVDRLQSVTVGYEGEDEGEEVMPPGQLVTGDHNLVNVQAVLFYRVRPDEVEDYVAQGDRVPGLLARAAESVMAEWVAGRAVDEVLRAGKRGLREALLARTPGRLAPYRLGVEVQDVRVAVIAPPEAVKAAFDSVARAETEKATVRYRAEQEAAARKRSARADVFRLRQQTAAYVNEQLLLARREAESFLLRLRQYHAARVRNPHYLRQIWEEERGKLFERLKQNGQVDLLDHHLGAGGLDLFTAPPLPEK